MRAVRADKEVIDFLNNCGNQNLQYLLVPSRLEAALLVLDTDRDGHIDAAMKSGRTRSSPPSRPSSRPAPRPAPCRRRRRRRRSRSSPIVSSRPRRAASSSSTRTAAGRSAFDCVEIKSQASHAMDATILLRITQLTGRCLRRQGRDREGVRQR